MSLNIQQRRVIGTVAAAMTGLPLGIIIAQSAHQHLTAIMVLAIIAALGSLLRLFGS